LTGVCIQILAAAAPLGAAVFLFIFTVVVGGFPLRDFRQDMPSRRLSRSPQFRIPNANPMSLLAYFRRFTALSAEESEALQASMTVLHYAKGDYVRRAGDAAEQSYFVIEGCVRRYRLLEGEEVTTHFYTEGQWIVSPASFQMHAPARDYLVCVEGCALVVGDEAKAQALFQRFPRFEGISRAVMETVLAEEQEAMARYQISSPEQRYQHLLDTRPDLLQRVPQYQLASYLGVKPESLSRIRRRLAKEDRG